MSGEKPRCSGIKSDGTPCGSTMISNISGLCYAHDPRFDDERRETQAKGGRNRARIVQLRGMSPPRLLPIYDRLEAALEEVHDGKLDPRAATAMAAIARALASILQAGEFEQRIRDLESGAGRTRDWRALP